MNKPGKILVTGGNRGIGKAIAEKLLILGYDVVITSRNMQVGEHVVKELTDKTGNKRIMLVHGDLSDVKSCYELVNKIRENHSDINCLINNAGVWMVEKKLDRNRLETSFMVNYLAPYILSRELYPVLKKNSPARIVNVNAGLYLLGKPDLDKTPAGGDFHMIRTYANSKLCNVLFTIDFAREIEGTGVTINAIHPGVVNTGLGDSPRFISKFIKLLKIFMKKPDYGAIAPVWLATSDKIKGLNGKFFNEKNETEYRDYVMDVNRQNDLRGYTDKLISKITNKI